MLKVELHIKKSTEMGAAAPKCMSERDGIQVTEKRVVLDAQTGLPATQLLLGHVVHFFSIHFKYRACLR